MSEILGYDFFHRDCLEVAPELVGKIIVRRLDSGETEKDVNGDGECA